MAKSKYEKCIRRLRFHLEQEQKCWDILRTIPMNEESKEMMSQLRKGKSAEIALLDQIVADVYDHPQSRR